MFKLFTHILLAYQLELYHTYSFLRVVYTTPFVFARQHRQSLVWTTKARILALGTGVVWWGGVVSTALAGKWVFAILLWIFLLPLLPLVIVGVHTLLLPIDFLARRRITFRATRRRITWTDTVVIGIAGSYGKTSQKIILERILSPFLRVLAPEGTLNTPLGLARTIEACADAPEIFIAELGEHYPWDITELVSIVRPTVGIITGITVQHLERFGSLDAIIDTIFELPRGLPKGSPCYLSTDNPHVQTGYDRNHSLGIEWCDFVWSDVSDITILPDFGGIDFTYRGIRLHTRLLGIHMIEPIVRACDILLRLRPDTDPQALARAVAEIPYVQHRMEPIHNTDRDLWIIDDSFNGNLEGVRAIVRYFADIRKTSSDTKRRRSLYLTPGLVELGAETDRIHREIGHLLAPVFDIIMIIETRAGTSLLAGLREAGYPESRILIYPDTLSAHADLGTVLREGDIIVFQNDWTDNYG